MAAEDRDSPFRFGPPEIFIGCHLGEADALALDDEGEVHGYKSLEVEEIKIESVEI